MTKGMDWDKVRQQNRDRATRPDANLGAMTDKKRRFLKDRSAQLKREAEARRRARSES